MQALEKMEAKLAAVERAKTEPIAVVGMGCRFPGGVKTPEALWRLTKSGENAVREIPIERFGAGAKRPDGAARWAGILQEVDHFDAAFFGIGRAEAIDMDPQHRLLLEVTWEAFEDAGIAVDQLVGSKTGVFVGIASRDYWDLLSAATNESRPYLSTGNATSIAAGRIAHIFGFSGPCATIDTACSSSFVALHWACQSLRRGECDMAVVGGANLLLDQKITEQLAALQILSPTGRCHTFDSRANGYVRAEGIGVLVLERVTDAKRRNDRIWALVRGSAVNHNGRATSLTAPSVQAQSAVIRGALDDARIAPERIRYVEVHSNGSPLGDPIEIEALKATVGKPRKDGSSCVLSSVKTVIGHAEAASGMASLMKAVCVLQHGVIPPNLQFEHLTPHTSLEGSSLVIPTSDTVWPRGEQPRYVGVSSTGLSGTNVHVVLEEAPLVQPSEKQLDRPIHVLVLSAKHPAALRDGAKQLLRHLGTHAEEHWGNVTHTLGIGRSHLEFRFAAVIGSHADASAALTDFVDGAPGAYANGRVSSTGMRKRLALLLPSGLPIDLRLRVETMPPALVEALRRGDEAIRAAIGKSIVSGLQHGDVIFDGADIVEKELGLFVLQYALVETWMAWGIAPSIIMGDGTGECVAAWASGLFGLEDAIALAHARARYIEGGKRSSAELSNVLARVKPTSPRRTLVPSVEGTSAVSALATVAYWERQAARGTAIDEAGTRLVSMADVGVVLECGVPRSATNMPRLTTARTIVSSLRHDAPVIRALLDGVATLYVHGFEVRWDLFDAPYPYRRLSLPSYPFQRQRYWFVQSALDTREAVASDEHFILGRSLPQRADRPEVRAWEKKIEDTARGRIGIQRFTGVRTVVAGGIVTIASAAIREILGEKSFELTLHLGDMPPVPDDNPPTMQVVVTPDGDQKATADVFFCDPFEQRWKRIAQGRATTARIEDDEEPAPPSMRPGRRQSMSSMFWEQRVDTLGADTEGFLVDQLMRRPGETLVRGLIARDRAADVFIHAIAAMTSVTHPAAYGRPWTIEAIDGLVAAASSPEGRAWLRINWVAQDLWSGRVSAEFVSDGGEVLALVRRIDLRAQDPVSILRSVHKDPLEDAMVDLVWKEMPPTMSAPGAQRKWLVITDESGFGEILSKHLESVGHSVKTFRSADLERDVNELDLVLAMSGPFWGVIYFGALDGQSNDALFRSSPDLTRQKSTSQALKIVERLSYREQVPRLWIVTRGAQGIGKASRALSQVGLWGLGRGLSLERPDMWGGMIDLDPVGGPEQLEQLAQMLSSTHAEDLVLLRGAKRYVARLSRVVTQHQGAINVRPDRTYILSRGLCSLGIEVARWLCARGARSLLVIDEPELIEGRLQERKILEGLGTEGVNVNIFGGNTADPETVQAVLYLTTLDRIGGVVHIDAGENGHQCRITGRNASDVFYKTLRETCLIPWTLHRLTSNLNLDFFVLFSSMTATLGWEGHGANAMAVEYLDAIAHHRRERGGRALCIHVAFPIDARAPEIEIEQQMLASGIQGMSAAVIMPAVERLLANDIVAATVGWVDWDVFEQAHRARAGRPLLEGVAAIRSGSFGPVQLRRRVMAAEAAQATRVIEDVMRKEFARVLGQSVSDLPMTADALSAMGMDSIMALQALGSIGAALGVPIPASVLLDQPNFDKLSRRIVRFLRPDDVGTEEEVASLRGRGRGGLLVEFVPSVSKPPFFVAPPLTGSALVFQTLAQHSSNDVRLCGFNAPGLDTDALPCDKIEILASRYIEVMRQSTPKGPYRIGGYSFGALVAYEMAHMLHRSGERVEACVLMDPPSAYAENDASRLVTMSQLFGMSLDESSFEKLNRDEQVSAMANSVGELLNLPPELGESGNQLRLYRAHIYALLEYVPKPYPGAITIIRARGTAEVAMRAGLFQDDPTFGWGALCMHGTHTYEIPGHHLTILSEPLVEGVAGALRTIFAEISRT